MSKNTLNPLYIKGEACFFYAKKIALSKTLYSFSPPNQIYNRPVNEFKKRKENGIWH